MQATEHDSHFKITLIAPFTIFFPISNKDFCLKSSHMSMQPSFIFRNPLYLIYFVLIILILL